jgi:diguanylate cyclase (GGDEF)-like protein/PAS domain S-box-containing protein
MVGPVSRTIRMPAPSLLPGWTSQLVAGGWTSTERLFSLDQLRSCRLQNSTPVTESDRMDKMGAELLNSAGSAVGEKFDPELFAELALSTDSTALWRFAFADDTVSWTTGLGEVLGMPVAVKAEIRARLAELIKPLIDSARNGQVWQNFELEQRIGWPSTPPRWIRFRARRFTDDGPGGVLGMVTDISEQREASLALSDLAERYRLLSDLSPDGIAVHEAGRVVYVNPAIVRLLGLDTSADVLGHLITEFVDPASIPLMRQRIERLVTQGATSEPAEANLLPTDGRTLTVETISVRTMWEGRPAFQVIMRDLTAQKAAEASLRYEAALVTHVSDAIIATDGAGVVTSWNPAAEVIYGCKAADSIGRPVNEMLGTRLDLRAVVRAQGLIEGTQRRLDGAKVDVRVSVAEMGNGYVLMCRDETERHRAQQRYSSVVASLEEGVVVVGATGLLESANPAALRILGLPAERIAELYRSPRTQLPLYDESGNLVPPNEYPSAITRRTGVPMDRVVLRLARPDGVDVWVAQSTRPLNSHADPPHAVVISFTDISEQLTVSGRLRYEATHDVLTGLANRALVLERIETVMRTSEGVTAVLFVDLDKFKVINDSLGHGVGDEVLQIVAKRLQNGVRDSDLVGRLGGDEFAVVVTGMADMGALRAITGHLRGSLADPITIDGRQLHINASIGIAVADQDDRRTGDELLRDADIAMYRAKTEGRGRYVVFDVELRERIQHRLKMELDLHEAIAKGHLRMAYQSIVNIRKRQMVGVEALVRWVDPQRGEIPPAEFIPLAEESDLINLIGAFTIRRSTEEIAAWCARNRLDIDLAVNLSVRQLEGPELFATVDQALGDTGLPAARLSLEITETALMRDPCSAHRILNDLRGLGVRLAIDDFGTGYSSLAQIHRLPVDTLKIDQSFISGIEESTEARVIVAGIIAMAHGVDLTVIAEGVETAEQLDILRDLGCDQAQGYYFGRPVPAGDLLATPLSSPDGLRGAR